jgi:hypothetical protein
MQHVRQQQQTREREAAALRRMARGGRDGGIKSTLLHLILRASKRRPHIRPRF